MKYLRYEGGQDRNPLHLGHGEKFDLVLAKVPPMEHTSASTSARSASEEILEATGLPLPENSSQPVRAPRLPCELGMGEGVRGEMP